MKKQNKQTVIELIKELFIVLMVVMGLRFATYGPSWIPSESMVPTANIGDLVAVANFPYGFTPLSIPYMPSWFAVRWFAKEPERGDVIVIRVPNDRGRDYIKRLIGLPGDRIEMKGGFLYVNDQPATLEKGPSYSYYDQNGKLENGYIYYETLPNGVRHEILKIYDFGTGDYDNTKEFVVPKDHYFVMGDNRDRSQDSRAIEKESLIPGYIHKKNLIGRADRVLFSTNARWLLDIPHWFSLKLLKERFFKRISP